MSPFECGPPFVSLFASARSSRHLCLSTFFTAFCLLALPQRIPAQRVVDLARVEECRECTIDLTEIVRLGDVDGPGIVEGATIVRWDSKRSQWVTFEFGRTRVKRYDSDGTFLSAFGREGDGPGEFRRISDLAVTDDGRLIILDSRRRRWLTFDATGRLLTESPLGLAVGRFFHVGGDTVVLASIDRQPQSVGYPFHVIDTSIGQTLYHFGSASGDFSVARPYAQLVLMGRVMGPRSTWRGRLDRLHLEEWNLEGHAIRQVVGEIPWLRDTPEPGGPPSQLLEFAVDRNGILWIVSSFPDPDWRDVRRMGIEGAVRSEDAGRFWDYRLDALDLENKQHLGSYRSPDEAPRLIEFEGRVAISLLQYDEALNPEVVIYDLRPRGR